MSVLGLRCVQNGSYVLLMCRGVRGDGSLVGWRVVVLSVHRVGVWLGEICQMRSYFARDRLEIDGVVYTWWWVAKRAEDLDREAKAELRRNRSGVREYCA